VALLESDDPYIKLKAIDGLQRLADHRAKITGLYFHPRPKRKHDPAASTLRPDEVWRLWARCRGSWS
jgi:hypothetical protein